jgi:hypothetical protein
MTRSGIFIAALALGALLIFLPIFWKVRARSGPGIGGNLQSLQLAKDVWLADGHTNEWPSGEDLFPYWSHAKSLNETFSRWHGELYFINRTGAPPFAYIPKASGSFRGGEVLVLTPSGLLTRHQ